MAIAVLPTSTPGDHDQPASPTDEIYPVPEYGLKRKARNDLRTPGPKRSRLDSFSPRSPPTSSAASLSATNNTSNCTPEPSSITGILRQHCRDRLCVRPIAWTSTRPQHLEPSQPELLECHFVRKELPSHRALDSGKGRLDLEDESLIQAATNLCDSTSMKAKQLAIIELLAAYDIHRWPPKADNVKLNLSTKSLPFWFGGRDVDTLKMDDIFSSTSDIPDLAYISLDTIRSLRYEYVYDPPCKRLNPPVISMRKKKLRRLQPEDRAEAEDPYIIALSIVVAQQQRRSQNSVTTKATGQAIPNERLNTTISCGSEALPMSLFDTPAIRTNTESFFKVHLLAIPSIRSQDLYFYTTYIPSGFLDKFDIPSRFSPSCPVLISYYRISLANPRKLIKQLHRVLCANTIQPTGGACSPALGTFVPRAIV